MNVTIKVSFGDIRFGKKTVLPLEIKGSLTDSQKLALLEFANSDGFVQLASAQRDIEDYEVPKTRSVTGLSYSISGGEVKVDSEQLDMEDVIGDESKVVGVISEVEEKKELNWLEQEELIAEQEYELVQSEEEQEEDELSDELE